MFRRHAAEHLVAQPVFADGEWGRRKIEDRLRAAFRELLNRIEVIAAAFPEVAIVPDVFADADAKAAATQLEHLGSAKRLEVAIFVEHVVCGQQRLSKPLA